MGCNPKTIHLSLDPGLTAHSGPLQERGGGGKAPGRADTLLGILLGAGASPTSVLDFSPRALGLRPAWNWERAGDQLTSREGPEIPEDADEQLQGHLLDLAVELLLPGPPGGPALVHVRAGAEVSQVQLVVQLKALDPGKEQRDSDHGSGHST